MKEKTFQEERMAGEGKEVAVRTCKVYVWKVVWTVEGLQLLTGMERAGLCCLCCWEENRKRRVPFSYSLRLCFSTSFNPHENPLGNELWYSPFYSQGNEGTER